jgi:Chemotaxis phosphatase CheX
VSEPSPELLAETLGSTLEEAAFVFSAPCEGPPPFAGQALEARIAYRGPSSGELRLMADSGLAAALAANLLGEDEGEANLGRSSDALGELLNMVLGAWVNRLFGGQVRCRLGVPCVRPVTAAEAAADSSGASCVAHLVAGEGSRIDLWFSPLPGERAP